MKKSLILIPVLAAIAAVSACGNSAEKGRTLARINGDNFTEGDLDLRLSYLEDTRREEILGDTAQTRREFNNILRNRLHALGGLKSPAGKSKSLNRRQILIDQRIVSQYYFETFLNAHGGHTRAEIKAFYEANSSRLTDDSGQVLPLSRALIRSADSLVARNGNVDSFFQASRRLYVEQPSVEVSLITTSTRKQAEAALKALRGGTSFSAAAARYSEHASKENQGRLGRVKFGEYHPEIASQVLADSLFFNEKTRLQPGQYSGILPQQGNGFMILRVEGHTAERLIPLDEVRARVTGDYIRDYKARRSQAEIDALKARYGVRMISREKEPAEKEIEAYYNAHADLYNSPETFELYHIELSDEARLNTALAKVSSLAQFKELASKISENSRTRAQQGRVGTVKREFTLPYGIGTMPVLFPALDEIESGSVDEVMQNPATQKWHAFWLAAKAAPKAKALDRVRALVVQDLKTNRIAEVAPEDSLAVIGATGKVIREDDVIFLRNEIPAPMQDRYTRENLVDFLLTWQVLTDEARALGLDKERKLRALRLQGEDNYWGGVYRDSVLSVSWETKPSVLKKTFAAHRELFFTSDTSARDWKPFARDVAASRFLTETDFKIEYNTYPERYMRDTVLMSYAEARPAIFGSLKPVAYKRLDAMVLESLKKRFKVKILDGRLQEPSLEPVAATYQHAQDLHYDRQLDQALSLYEQLREKFPRNEGLQDSLSFGIAQIYIEQERFSQAMAEYRRISYLYPKSTNDYKAMFMVGFIQAEHLRQDSAAVRSFEAMLKKYPDSDLSDDADWMVRNIRSGGELMPALEDDFEDAAPAEETGG